LYDLVLTWADEGLFEDGDLTRLIGITDDALNAGPELGTTATVVLKTGCTGIVGEN